MLRYGKIEKIRYNKTKKYNKTKLLGEGLCMKKLIVTIFILLIIFIGMYIYKQNKISTNKSNEITIDEITKIETYLQKIYMWREITGEALPVFESINDAPDIWVWEVVKKNLEEYELSAEQLQNKAKEIFGQDFQKEFPKNGYEYMEYNQETNTYYAIGSALDNEEDVFLLDKIEKQEEGYAVQIIEYLEDYSQGYETTNSEYDIQIKNLNNEVIGTVKNTESETNIQQFVKDNIDRFTKKEVILKTDETGNIYVKSVKNS